ncbi:MAG: ABC transporter permease [Betaproteobacteria bacterium]
MPLADTRALAELSTGEAAAPVAPGSAQIVYDSNNWNSQGVRVTLSYLDVRDWPLEDGVPFTEADLRSISRVAIVGQTVVRQIFGEDDPVGKTIRIRNGP